ncbi:MAG: FAD-dependent thymidylate synthase [candidate division WOR-3 bacterium]
MKLVWQEHEWIVVPDNALSLIERAGRTCYQSHDRAGEPEKFTRALLERGHHSVIEHAVATCRFVTDRGVTHELVRHRLASYSQESTRYCRYEGHVTFVIPVWATHLKPGIIRRFDLSESIPDDEREWAWAMLNAETSYLWLLDKGWPPEKARAVLPNSLKTEIVVTANLREWRHVFSLRTSRRAHPQIRHLMKGALLDISSRIKVIFDDLVEGLDDE